MRSSARSLLREVSGANHKEASKIVEEYGCGESCQSENGHGNREGMDEDEVNMSVTIPDEERDEHDVGVTW